MYDVDRLHEKYAGEGSTVWYNLTYFLLLIHFKVILFPLIIVYGTTLFYRLVLMLSFWANLKINMLLTKYYAKIC